MSFKEKSAWVVLIAMLWVFGGYAWSLYQGGGFGAGTTGVMFVTIIGFVILIVIAHIIVAIFSARPGDEEEDERDRRLEMQAECAGGFVLGVFVFTGLAVALWRGDYMIANILFLGLAASEIVKNLWQVTLYRRGA